MEGLTENSAHKTDAWSEIKWSTDGGWVGPLQYHQSNECYAAKCNINVKLTTFDTKCNIDPKWNDLWGKKLM